MKSFNEMLNSNKERDIYKRISAIMGLYYASKFDLVSARMYAHMNNLDSEDYTGLASYNDIFDFIRSVARKEKVSLDNVILYDTKEENRLTKLTNSTMQSYMDSGDDKATARRKTAIDLFDGKTLVNEYGTVYFIKVNDDSSERILDIESSKYDAESEFFNNGKNKITLANVPFQLG